MAAASNIPVVPVVLKFADPRDFWVGKESFVSHAKRRFAIKSISVKLIYGKAIWSDDPLVLSTTSQDWINSNLTQNK